LLLIIFRKKSLHCKDLAKKKIHILSQSAILYLKNALLTFRIIVFFISCNFLEIIRSIPKLFRDRFLPYDSFLFNNLCELSVTNVRNVPKRDRSLTSKSSLNCQNLQIVQNIIFLWKIICTLWQSIFFLLKIVCNI